MTRHQATVQTSWTALLASIANGYLSPAGGAGAQLGAITLHDHQTEALSLLVDRLRRYRGALLADDVGIGKTFVALAVARATASAALVVAPAALREMWLSSAARAAVEIRFVSVERLSRGKGVPTCDLLIVDEAHNLRNPSTRRFDAVSLAATRSAILLLSATPVHNSEKDLRAVLSLFLGAAAFVIPASSIARYVVRRTRAAIDGRVPLPTIEYKPRRETTDSSEVLKAIALLPPPLPPADGGRAEALLTFTLLRLWASSNAALRKTLRKRLTSGAGLATSLESGIYPTAAALRSWCVSDEVLQLPLFGLLDGMEPPQASSAPVALLLSTLQSHLDGVRRILAALEQAPSSKADEARVGTIRQIRAAHPNQKIVAFSQFAETVGMYQRHTRNWGRTAAVTGSGASIASGNIPRAELLRLFAPCANNAPAAAAHQRVDLLFCTDLLSEGTNMQDAAVLVHLDMPWTAVRLQQRVGRIVRTGSPHDKVYVYTMSPPAPAEDVLQLERRLLVKLSVASRSVGSSGTVLPLLQLPSANERASPEIEAELRATLMQLCNLSAQVLLPESTTAVGTRPANSTSQGVGHLLASTTKGAVPHPNVAAISGADGRAALALVHDSDSCPRLLLLRGGSITDDPEQLLGILNKLVRLVSAGAVTGIEVEDHELSDAESRVAAWFLQREARTTAGISESAHINRSRRKVFGRIARISSQAPLHLRPHIHALAARARAAASLPVGAGGERVLDQLATAPLPDEAWLRSISAFGDSFGAGRHQINNAPAKLLALLLMR